MYVHDGTSFKDREPMVWTGTAWKRLPISYFYNGSWMPQAVMGQQFSMSTMLTYDVVAPTPTTQTYTETKSFAIAWGQTYFGSGGQRTDNTNLYQGYNTSGNGNMKSLIGFSVTGIPAGATCLSATMSLYAAHWYNNSGGIAVIGTHNYSSKPATYNAGNVWHDRTRYTWNTKTGQRTINLGTAIGQDLLNTAHKGIVIGPGPTTANTYYGYFPSTGGYRPVLTLKYSYVA